jgi:RNA polymerase sigma-70 factor, ECF subfamily
MSGIIKNACDVSPLLTSPSVSATASEIFLALGCGRCSNGKSQEIFLHCGAIVMSGETPKSMWTTLHAALIGGTRWEEFLGIYGPVIRTWASKMGHQDAVIDDLTQEVYMKLFKGGLERYDKDKGEFRGWLFRVLQNVIINYFRTRGRRPGDDGTGDSKIQERLEQEAADDLATELSNLTNSHFKLIEQLQAKCNPQTWEMVTAFCAGQSAAEVAAQFGTTAGAIYQAVYRIKKLAQTLKKTP